MITTKGTPFYCLFLFSMLILMIACQTNEPVISIQEAKKLPFGSQVTISGTVTVASGTFASSRPYGYAIQDNSAGIYIIDSIPPMEGAFSVGELVTVSGTTEEDNGLFCLREITAEKMGKGEPIKPLSVKTGYVNESTEGLIVTTSGIIDSLFNDPPYGYKVFINDGSGLLDIYVNTSTNLLGDTLQWQLSDSLSATGFSSQYGPKYECDPRTGADIQVVATVE